MSDTSAAWPRGRQLDAASGVVKMRPRASAQGTSRMEWNLSTDVVVIGAGAAGLAAAVSARDHGAAVIVVEENYDIGGHAMLSGGRVHLGGGNALQKKFNIKDSPDQVFADWVTPRARRQPLQRPRPGAHLRRRVRADLPVPARQRRHLHREADRHAGRLDRAAGLRHPRMAHPERGDRAAAQPQRLGAGAPACRKRAQEGRADPAQARDDADRARSAARRTRARHRGRRPTASDIAIEAKKGVVIATGGHTGNVNFRRMFDPRLTEEYQQAGLPYSFQGADGELAAMDIGASLWATGTQTSEVGPAITKTRHVGTPLGLSQPLLRDRQPDLPSLQGDRPDRDGLAGGHPGQPVRQAVLERARQLLRLPQRGAGQPRRQRPS